MSAMNALVFTALLLTTAQPGSLDRAGWVAFAKGGFAVPAGRTAADVRTPTPLRSPPGRSTG
jgi:hypothetical protein